MSRGAGKVRTGERQVFRLHAEGWGGELMRGGYLASLDEQGMEGYRHVDPALLLRGVRELVDAGLLPVIEIDDREYVWGGDLDRFASLAQGDVHGAAGVGRVFA